MKLSELTDEFDKFQPIVVEAHRLSEQHRLINESREPQTGLYFWVPENPSEINPKPHWTLYAFYESKVGDVTHEMVWDRYLCRLLNLRSFEARRAYAGLPRGRVVEEIGKRGWIILHGNNTPGGKRGLEEVRRYYNLPMKLTRIVFDPHEAHDERDAKILKVAMKYKQRLPKSKVANPKDIDMGSQFVDSTMQDDEEYYPDEYDTDDYSDLDF